MTKRHRLTQTQVQAAVSRAQNPGKPVIRKLTEFQLQQATHCHQEMLKLMAINPPDSFRAALIAVTASVMMTTCRGNVPDAVVFLDHFAGQVRTSLLQWRQGEATPTTETKQ